MRVTAPSSDTVMATAIAGPTAENTSSLVNTIARVDGDGGRRW